MAKKAKQMYRIEGTNRYSTTNYGKLKSIAKGQVTKAINKGNFLNRTDANGVQLKQSVMDMADRIQPSQYLYNKLMAMDPENLAIMYSNAKFTFNEYFSYENAYYEEGYGFIFEDEKFEEVERFIDNYERYFGSL